MPRKVQFKVSLYLMLGLSLLLFLWASSWVAGLGGTLLGLFYVEMIYPKWNFFGPALLNVKSLGKDRVAITFDDGPSEWTPQILDTLKREGVRATFFLLGKNIERFPEVARRIQSEGHSLGLHGYSHTKLHLKGRRFIVKEVDLCLKAFSEAQLRHQNLFRFPHGFKNFLGVSELKRRGLRLCGWGRGVWDSKRPGVDLIVHRSLQLRGGEILLLHDGDGAKSPCHRAQTAEAVSRIIQGLKTKGYSFVTLDQIPVQHS